MTTLTPLENIEDTYLVDTKFLGHKEHVGVYIIDDQKTTILDTGASTGTDIILDALSELEIEPTSVDFLIPSHVHLDHAGGGGYLLEECTEAEVICHRNGIDYISDSEKVETLVTSAHRALGEIADGYGDLKPIQRDRIRAVEDGDIIELGSRNLRILDAHGHAPHQMALYEPDGEWIFTADEAGMYLYDRFLPATPPPNFNFEQTLESLKRFSSLNPKYLLYPHFGVHSEPDKALSKYRNVLTEWVDEIKTMRERLPDKSSVVDEVTEQDSFYYEIWDEASARQTLETDTRGVLLYLER